MSSPRTRFKELRIAKGWTVDKLAQLADVRVEDVEAIEGGTRLLWATQ